MKKTANLVFTVLFLLFLGAVAAITLKQGDSTYSYFENRSLAKAPEYSRESLVGREPFFRLGTLFHGPCRRPRHHDPHQHPAADGASEAAAGE